VVRPSRSATGAPANVVGDFHERGGEGLERAGGENDFVVGGEAGEFVGMRTERQTAEFADFASGAFGEFGMGVEAGADGGNADGQVVESVEGLRDAEQVAVEKTDPQENSCSTVSGGVLQVGAADFDDGANSFALAWRASFFTAGGGRPDVSVAAAMCMAWEECRWKTATC
jgi:hypothetical protein